MSVARSLHVGVDVVSSFRYGRRLTALSSSKIDAREFARVAAGRGYSAVTLVDDDATIAKVSDAIAAAARALRRGDSFVLTYSGHGMAGDTPAGFQQSWCLYDETLVRYGGEGLDALLAKFRSGVRILIVANCCYSGARGARTPRTPPIRANVIRLSASTSREVSFDRPDGRGPSPFIARILGELNSSNDGGFPTFVERLASGLPATPQLEIAGTRDEAFLRLGPFRLGA